MTEYAIRIATGDDVAAMKAIRDGVRENVLVSVSIEAEDYVRAMTVDGRAWVATVAGEVVGFVYGRLTQRDIWALFVREAGFAGRDDQVVGAARRREAQGIGSALMDVVERWMFERGVDRIELTTEPGTRAERLYRRRGWRCAGTTATGELRFSLVAHG